MLNFKQYCCSPIFKICFLFIFLCGTATAYSQTSSLETKSYKELVQNYFGIINTNLDSALVYIDAAYKVAKKEKNTTATVDALFKRAFVKSSLMKKDEALKDIETAISLAKPAKNYLLLGRFYTQKGNILTEIGKHDKAIDAFIESKKYAVLSGNKIDELIASNNIAFIKQLNHAYDEAITIYKENLEIVDNVDIDATYKKKHQISLYFNLSDSYLKKQELNDDDNDDVVKAKYYNDIGLKICSKKDNPYDYYTLLMNEVIIRFEKEKYEESIKLNHEIIVYAEEVNYEKLRSTSYFYMGKNYDEIDNPTKAIEYLEKFHEILKTSKETYSNERQLHTLLARSYSKIGNHKKSKFHNEKQDILLKKERKKNVKVVSNIHIKNDIPKINEELKTLATDFEVQEKRKKLLYGISILLVVLLIGSIFFYKMKMKRIQKRAEAVLQKAVALENQQVKQKEERQKTVSSISEKVTDSKAALLLEKLAQFEEREEYLSLNCSLSYVADKLESNTSYVSNVINNYKNKTFKSYITELRINTALIRLKNDEKLRSYTIKAIAEEFGFKRQETFSKAFKAQTGIYPSQYLKKLRDNLKID